MLKKLWFTATLSFMIGTLGMGYPHESESQQENAYLVYSEAVTSRMSEETHSSAQTVSRVQAQGARSIARYAKEDTRIQEAAMPLCNEQDRGIQEENFLTEEGNTASAEGSIRRIKGRKQRDTVHSSMCCALTVSNLISSLIHWQKLLFRVDSLPV